MPEQYKFKPLTYAKKNTAPPSQGSSLQFSEADAEYLRRLKREGERQQSLGQYGEASKLFQRRQDYIFGKAQREAEFAEFTKHQLAGAEQIREGARQSIELERARQTGAVEAATAQNFARRGIGDSGVAGMGIIQAEQALGSLALQAVANFDADFGRVLQAQQAGFLAGQFQWFHDMQAMRTNKDFQLELMYAQADIQKDQQRWQQWMDVLGAGGGLAATFFTGGAAGPMTLATAGGIAGGPLGSGIGGAGFASGFLP